MIELVIQAELDTDFLRGLAVGMRRQDREEIEKIGVPADPDGFAEKMVEMLGSCAYACGALVDGMPAAVWGLQLVLPLGHGVPWLLTAHHVDRYPLTFTRAAMAHVEYFLKLAPVLIQWVDADYTKAQRWMERFLGFRRAPEADTWMQGRYPFLAFVRRRR